MNSDLETSQRPPSSGPSNRRCRIGLAGVTFAAMLLSGCKKAEPDAGVLVNVQAEHPEIGEISEHITADATLTPIAQAAISPKIASAVTKFYVQRGSKVKAGQLLAELENRDVVAAAMDNKGQYTAAQASFDMQTKAQLPDDYTKAELDLAQAKAQRDLQADITNSRKKLLDEGAIPGRDYDTAVATLVQAQAAYDVALNHLNSLKKVSREASIQQAQGQLSSAKGKYLAAEALVSYSEIRSPIAGVVTDRPLFAGETAIAGTTLITVMDTSSLLAKVHLSQTVAQQLKVGGDAAVTIPGFEAPVAAKVSLISPALDPGSTTIEVWLRVDNHSGKYKAGSPVRTSIRGRTIVKATKIPLSAILTAQDGSKSVMVVGSNGVARKTAVTLGINDGEDIQVTEGLSSSDMVISVGAYGLDDGTKVKVGKPDADEDKKQDPGDKGADTAGGASK